MIIELRDQDVAQKTGAGHASLDRGRRCWLLDNLLAPPIALLQPGDLQHLELGADIVEQFVDVLAEQTKLLATPWPVVSGHSPKEAALRSAKTWFEHWRPCLIHEELG